MPPGGAECWFAHWTPSCVAAAGGGGGYSAALAEAIGRAADQNILFIAAAGNAAGNVDTSPSYPCSYSNANIICVASITSSGGLSSFSNWGATGVDIGAPGSGIWVRASCCSASAVHPLCGMTCAATGAEHHLPSSLPASLQSTVPTRTKPNKPITPGYASYNGTSSEWDVLGPGACESIEGRVLGRRLAHIAGVQPP